VRVQELRSDDPAQVGPYRILGRIGTGGMGRVFAGRSAGGRLVAVKVIRDELASDPEFRARFRQEVAGARLVSGLFTAPVVDADLDGPVPWLATGYVAGPSLASAVASNGPLPAPSVLALAAALAEGLAAIHAAEVVHRDLKPSNVLLAADGPRIIDFGIARAAEATSLTQSGLVVGSPGFMSPEQAEGQEVGPPSDVFSLGAVLTFAATGSGPFGTGYATALMYRVVHGAPDLEKVPDQARRVIERCLAKDPAQRPTPADLLAELGGADITADWLPGPFTRPRPAVTALPAVTTPPDSSGTAGGVKDMPPVAVDQRTALIPGASAGRSRREQAGVLLARLDHLDPVTAVQFSPGGERMLTVSGRIGRLWNRDIQEVAQLRHQQLIRDDGVVFSPDGVTIATQTVPPLLGRKNPVLLWDAGEGVQLAELPHQQNVTDAMFSPDGTRIATASVRSFRLWDPRAGRPIAKVRSADEITKLVFSPDSTRVMALTYTGTRTPVLHAATGTEVFQLRHRGALQSAAFSPDGSRLLTLGSDRTARLWDAANGRELPWRTRIRLVDAATGNDQSWTQQMAQWAAAFNPAVRQLATASVDHTVRLWDPASGQELASLPHVVTVTDLAFSPDGTRLVTISNDRDAHVWDPGNGRELASLPSYNILSTFLFSPDGARLMTASTDGRVRLWALASGAEISHVRHAELCVFSPDLTRLATRVGPVVHLLDLTTGLELARMAHTAPVTAMLFSPDSARLATRSGKTVALWAT
jgi:WD40 repeat protein